MRNLDTEIDVSIIVLTYFHEDYIDEAFKSIFEQKTSYKYEIIVSDDCSGDRTQEIISNYAEKYKEIVKVHFNKKNIGIPRNLFSAECRCRGRYVTILAGDDYWIDNKRIQKQVDFLDLHKEYFAVTTNVELRYEREKVAHKILPLPQYRNKKITLDMYLHGVNMGMHGVMMRNIFLKKEGKDYFSLMVKASEIIDDTAAPLLILNKGPVYSMDFNSVVYRVQKEKLNKHNFNSLYSTLQFFENHIISYNYINENFPKRLDLYYIYKSLAIGIFTYCIKRGLWKEFRGLYILIPKEYRKRIMFMRMMMESVFGAIRRRMEYEK